MQPSISNGVTAFSPSSISQINSHIDPITNSQCVQTAIRGNGVCTQGAEDWDFVDCGSCTPSPGVCNTPAGSCGSVQGTDTCGGSCTVFNLDAARLNSATVEHVSPAPTPFAPRPLALVGPTLEEPIAAEMLVLLQCWM